tara:strand:+ start:1562 stop:2701 length:1140 start_codon:yes stop_codon:yes gene_type:complete
MATTKVTANVLADNSVTQAKLADDAVGADELAASAVVTASIVDDAVTAAKLAANAVVNASIASGAAIDMDKLDGDSLASAITDFAQDDLVILSDTSDSGNLVKITTSNFEDAIFGNISGDATVAAGGALTIANNAIETAMINADAITGAKIADDAIDSEHYTDGSVDTAHLADGAITAAKIADGAIVAAEIADNAVTTAKINADAVTGAKIADDAINSEHYTDGSIDTAHIADDQVTQAKIADDAVGADQLAANAVVTASITDDNVTHAKLEPRYTTLVAKGTGTDQTLDFATATTFTATMNGNATFTITNPKQGQVVDLIVSGNYTLTLAMSGATFNKVGSVDYDGSTTNLIQIVVADDASSEIFYYSVAPIASDTTP